jgi:beta-aspartyl-dipeptidase (metallo-type)
MLLLKNVTVYSPQYDGIEDILVCNDKIIYISTNIKLPSSNFPDVEVIDGSGLIAVPGFVDLHVHFAGGGGENGFSSRTPDLMLSELTGNGITTCVGLLGTDGTTRSMGNLIAKARALEEEGITTYTWTGSYEMPTRTITDSPRGDIILVDKIIGVGEIAISDHRASHPSEEDLIHLACEARLGGMLSGKCGILHMHVGDAKKGLQPVFAIHEYSEIPFENILPTHVNRNRNLLGQAIEYLKLGGYVDITTGIKPEGDDAVYPGEAYKSMLDGGISPYNITMSSDSGGSMPLFDSSGKLTKLTIGMPSTDLETLKDCVNRGISLDQALIPLTESPAKLLKLKNKGCIKENYDADIILLDKDYKIHTVIAKGKVMVKKYDAIAKGTFE